MKKSACWLIVLLPGVLPGALGQIKRTTVPLGDAIRVALTNCTLTSDGAQPFHLRVSISEPENPQSPYQGTIEEWWVSADQWRREVTEKDGKKMLAAKGIIAVK